MKKLSLGVAAAVASLALLAGGAGVAQAAAPPEVIACLGAGTNDGSFQTQTIGAANIITETACVSVNFNDLAAKSNNLLAQLAGIKPPTQTPTIDDLQKLADDLENFDPSSGGILAPLVLEQIVCNDLHLSSSCNAVTAAVLGTALGVAPLGKNVTLDAKSGYCYQGTISGTGTAFGSSFYNLDWTADYSSGLGGLISGTATSGFGSNQQTADVTGIIGPGCGAGVKGLVLLLT